MRRDVSFVFQDPGSSLNPRLPIGESIGEPLLLQKSRQGRGARASGSRSCSTGCTSPATCATATRTSCPAASASGSASPGRWRSSPKLLIADEPTSALDVSVQARVLDLFQELQREIGFACLFISHDLAVVEILSRRIAVMQDGQLVELGTREQILNDPQQDYTKRLLAAVPVPDPDEQRRRRIERDADSGRRIGLDDQDDSAGCDRRT